MPTINPKRSTQGSPLTSLQHDLIHTIDRQDINTLIAQVNTLVAGSGIPTGVVLTTGSSILDAGFLWCDGSAVSRTTYAALFARIGVTFGAGDNSTTFNLPDCKGRVAIGAGAGSGLTNRVLGTYFGAETYHDTRSFTITNQPVTATVPSMTVSFSNMGSVTFPSFNAGTKDSLTFDAGAQGTLSGGSFPTISIAPQGGVISVSVSAPTHTFGEGIVTGVIPTISATVSPTDIAAGLKTNSTGGSFQVLSAGTPPSASLSGYIAPSQTGGTNTVSGAAATTPSTSITGATVSGSTVAANTQIAIMNPAVVFNFIIKT